MTDPLSIHYPRKTEEGISWLRKQLQELIRQPEQRVTCICGHNFPLQIGYRCLYCGEYFCLKCAESHFGKTRELYNKERFLETQT
jgi:hypothetical protein